MNNVELMTALVCAFLLAIVILEIFAVPVLIEMARKMRRERLENTIREVIRKEKDDETAI